MASEWGTPEWHEERKGLYGEEVHKLVDGIVEDVKAGHITTPGGLRDRVDAAVRLTAHVNDDLLCAEVLRYSRRACEGISKVCRNPKLHRLMMEEKRFPWRGLAEEAMFHDCYDLLMYKPEVEALYKK